MRDDVVSASKYVSWTWRAMLEDKRSLVFSARDETHEVMGRAGESDAMVVCVLTTVETATCIESMCCGSGID